MIRRPPRSTRVRSSAASDVYKRQRYETGLRVDLDIVHILPYLPHHTFTMVRNRLLDEKQKSPVLTCEGLRKRFGEIEAVRGVSFEIAPGESYGLLGPNGAGKTTTILIVAGLLEADAGEAIVAGRRLTTKS